MGAVDQEELVPFRLRSDERGVAEAPLFGEPRCDPGDAVRLDLLVEEDPSLLHDLQAGELPLVDELFVLADHRPPLSAAGSFSCRALLGGRQGVPGEAVPLPAEARPS